MDIYELDEINKILFRDLEYRHFIKNIKKDFFNNRIDDKTSSLKSFYIDNNFASVGFCIIGFSKSKLKMWEKVFHEEGWVNNDFKIRENSFEIMYLYVMPEYRNQKKASILLDNVIKYAKLNNTHEIYAYVSAPDNYAFNFYRKRGAETICSFSEGEKDFTAFLRWKV